jgi:hypothetical protein
MNQSKYSSTMLLLSLLAVSTISFPFKTTPLWGESFTLNVKHDHVHGSSHGKLTIDNDGVRYTTTVPKEQRQWSFTDIQEIQFLSEKRLNLVSYEGSRWHFGGDRIYKFEMTDGTVPRELVAFVTARYPKPISDRIPTKVVGRYEISVRHLHRTGGCPGTLVIADNGITYTSEDGKDSRFWRYSDVESVGTSGPYDLRLGTYEHGPLQFGGTKEFRFQLKTTLNEEAYRFVWEHVNSIQRLKGNYNPNASAN